MNIQEIITVFKEVGFSGRIYRSMEDAMKAEQEPYEPVKCSYKGISRNIHPAVCEWHKSENDSECGRCA